MNSAPKPPVPITNPAFKYVPAANTDIRALFARVRAEQAAAKQLKPWSKVNP